MTYTPTVWKDDDLITADRLNKLEQGVQNEQTGPTGPQGEPGKGVPTGGAKDQILAKRSAADYDTYWLDPPDGGGGGVAGVSSFNGRTGAVVPRDGDYTAQMVGARPADWMPTAVDVGARPNIWMPTAADVGARPIDWMPTADDVGAATMEEVNTAIAAAITGAIKETY